MKIFVLKSGQQFGPYNMAESQSRLQEGTFDSSDLAWHEGLADWVPISIILGISSLGLPGQSPPSEEDGQHEFGFDDGDDIDAFGGAIREAFESGALVREEDVALLRNGSSLITKAISTTFVGGSRLRLMCEELVNKVSEGNRRCEIQSEYEGAVISILAESYVKVLSSALTDEWFLHLVLKSIRSEDFGSSINNSVIATLSNALCDAAEKATLQLDYSPANVSDSGQEPDWDGG